MISGCSADLLINICLTCLGYLPGHIHAFYLEWVYFDRREKGKIPQASCIHAANFVCEAVSGNSGLNLLQACTRTIFKLAAPDTMALFDKEDTDVG